MNGAFFGGGYRFGRHGLLIGVMGKSRESKVGDFVFFGVVWGPEARPEGSQLLNDE